MIPFNNLNATQDDLIANAGGPIEGDRISNVGGGNASRFGDLILLQTGAGYITLEAGGGYIQLEA